MIRKFNYTGRRRIPRSRVNIQLVPAGDYPSFDAELDLAGLDLPEDAAVFVEAYDKSSYMRFGYGTVAKQGAPQNRVLNELQSRDAIFFRVKVVDMTARHGRVLAIADGLPPVKLKEQASERESLLHVRFSNLGEEVWRLDFTGDMPILELNQELSDIGLRETVRSDDLFVSLVLPAVFRQILTQIVVVEEHTETSGDDWRSMWLRFVRQLGVELDIIGEGEYARAIWIDREAVAAFCRRFNFKERYRRAKGGGA